MEEIITLFKENSFQSKPVSHNLFNIGSRGFYENPFTEILSYILSSETEFNYRAEFIQNLLKDCVAIDDINSLIEFSQVSTQYATNQRNFIDLLLFNKSCIVVFENKIFHEANNPFQDYFEDISLKYPNHNKYFILFSYRVHTAPTNWKYISISENFKRFLEGYTFDFKNKWDHFIYDFLEHFCIKKSLMTDTEKNFYETNFHKIITASNNLDQFINDVAEAFKNANSIYQFQIANWNGNTKAIRFYPIEKNSSNAVIVFTAEGKFSISVYYYSDFEKNIDVILPLVGHKYESWKEGKINSVCCFALRDFKFDDLKSALTECQNQVTIMRKYYN